MAAVADAVDTAAGAKDVTKDGSDAKDDAAEPPKEMVPFHTLFRYADGWDMLIIGVGVLMSIAQGAMMPAPVEILQNTFFRSSALHWHSYGPDPHSC